MSDGPRFGPGSSFAISVTSLDTWVLSTQMEWLHNPPGRQGKALINECTAEHLAVGQSESAINVSWNHLYHSNPLKQEISQYELLKRE